MFGIGPDLEPVGAANPGLSAIGKGNVAVGLTPDEKAIRRVLDEVATRLRMLVLDAIADDVRYLGAELTEADRQVERGAKLVL